MRRWHGARWWAGCALLLVTCLAMACGEEEEEYDDHPARTLPPRSFTGELWEDRTLSDCTQAPGAGADQAGPWGSAYILEWSPDGEHLVFDDGDRNWPGSRLLVVDAGGTRVRTLVVANEGVFQRGFYASVSPVNGDVLYSSCEFPATPLKAVQERHWNLDGSWRHERSTLIEPRSMYGYELAVVGFDGANKRRLTHKAGWEISPVWSPDGRRFVYLHEQLRLIVAEEGAGERTVYTGNSGGLRWSPDGRKGLFRASTGGRDSYETTLYVVDVEAALEGSTADALTEIVVTEPLVRVTLGSFSPDGEQVVWGERKEEGDEASQVIYVGNADGSGKRRVVEFPDADPLRQRLRAVRWSPVGPRIMFWTTSTHYNDAGYGRDTNVIYVVNEDGSRTRIHQEEGSIGGWAYATVRWSPDGSRIAIRTEGAVMTVASNGTDRRVLAKLIVPANPRPPHPPVNPAACSNGVVIPDPAAEPGLVADCEALLEGRDSLAPDVFLDWHEGLPIREWEGVTVAGEPARVTEVVLRGFGLRGVIPQSFGKLEHLVRLDLWHNEIRGGIRSELGDLANLRSLDLSYNRLRGPIAPELGRLTKLESLDLSHNELSGSIPGELGALANLRVLKLQDNDLLGGFPEEFANFGNLEELRLSRNSRLEGCVPDNLRAVEAVGTRLQRCQPDEDE